MHIVGIGTEIVECVRIGRMILRHGESFLDRVFTAAETRFCQSRKNVTEQFAAHWAAKQAIRRALSIHSMKGLAWTDIEIQHKVGRRAKVELKGAVREKARRRKVASVLITLAPSRVYATATAMAVRP